MRYLINTSRIHWRKEMEVRAAGDAEIDKKYFLDNHFTLGGNRLTNEEYNENFENFKSKCYTVGYILHKHKNPSKAWLVWLLENEINTKENKKGGGTGKSILFETILREIIKVSIKPSGDLRITENRFFFERAANVDFFLCDDAHKNFPLRTLYSQITGTTEIDIKNSPSYELSYKNSSKYGITSQYPPRDVDGALHRRIQFVVFSDWYHERTDETDYRETRSVYDDFGRNICYGEQYKEEWWNEDINFLFDCVQFYLACCDNNVRIMPPLKNIFNRINRSQITDDFNNWANDYINLENGTLNALISKSDMINSLRDATGVEVGGKSRKDISVIMFTKSLMSYCALKGYVLNPSALCNRPNDDGVMTRIFQPCEDINSPKYNKPVEFYYIQKDNNNNENENEKNKEQEKERCRQFCNDFFEKYKKMPTDSEIIASLGFDEKYYNSLYIN
jgi:hypothetical protein